MNCIAQLLPKSYYTVLHYFFYFRTVYKIIEIVLSFPLIPGDFFTPVKDLRNKLNVSRQHSKLNRRFSTPSSGFKTSSSHHFDRAVSYTISRDHRKASSENVKSDPLRPVNKGDRDLNPGDVYQTPKRSSFVDLLNNNSKTPRTPDQYLASRSLSFSTLNETWATELLTRSQSYRYSFIDSHCHLDFLYSRMGVPFNTQYNEFMERHAHSYPVNYEGCVAVFCNPRTFNLHSKYKPKAEKVFFNYVSIKCH